MAPQYSIDPKRNYSIAVIGGGIGGLCTAIGLLHHGVPVEIYEAAPAFAEIGAGVSLGPNAARAMQLIDPAIHAGFLNCATNNAWPQHRSHWFSFRKGEDTSTPFGAKLLDLECATGQSSVHRARFLDELVRLVPEKVAHFGKRLNDITENADSVTLHFADGTSATHTAAIGCDGVKSRVREIVLGPEHPTCKPTFSGKYAYRGLIPMSQAAAVMGDELARNSQMFLGHGGHILTFPIEKGETMNVVAFGTKNDGKWEDPEWVKPMDRVAMEADFKGWSEAVQKVLGMMTKPDVWALFDLPAAPTYVKGRICMLGDAAHASTPHNGAGAGQAIEDALCMSRVMRLVYEGKDVTRAFEAFDRVRRPRSQRQVKVARQSGWLYDLQLEGYGDDWEKVGGMLREKQRWIWEHDLEADVAEVERLFRGEEARL